MAEANIQIVWRQKTGHHTAKHIRQEGRIPGIYYAHGEESRPISIDAKAFNRMMKKSVNILNIVFPDGKEHKSIIREVQRNPVTDEVVHVDIMGIQLTEKIRLSIPIVLVGTPAGIKDGGILEHLIREVEVEGLPLDIPEKVELDVSGLKIGQAITLEHVQVEKFKFLTDVHYTVANVIQPKMVIEEAPVAEVVEGEAAEEEESKEPAEEKETE